MIVTSVVFNERCCLCIDFAHQHIFRVNCVNWLNCLFKYHILSISLFYALGFPVILHYTLVQISTWGDTLSTPTSYTSPAKLHCLRIDVHGNMWLCRFHFPISYMFTATFSLCRFSSCIRRRLYTCQVKCCRVLCRCVFLIGPRRWRWSKQA
jgi:hypothetical protein